jgi:hypothetical protein
MLLDVFALVVLLVLVVAVVGVLILLGMMPGRIARQRGHPQADAISVCGWWGLITLGILLPVAWIWAYTNSGSRPTEPEQAGTTEDKEGSKS